MTKIFNNNSTYKLSTSDYMVAIAIILMVISAILMIVGKNGYIDQLFVYIYILLFVGAFIKYVELVIKE